MAVKMREGEAVKILREHQIPFSMIDTQGCPTLLRKKEIDLNQLRRLGFRISRGIGDQLVICYKGWRFGIIV